MYDSMTDAGITRNFGYPGTLAVCMQRQPRSLAVLRRQIRLTTARSAWLLCVSIALLPLAALADLRLPSSHLQAMLLALAITGMLKSACDFNSQRYLARMLAPCASCVPLAAGVNLQDLSPAARAWHARTVAAGRPLYGFDLEIMSMMNEADALRCR